MPLEPAAAQCVKCGSKALAKRRYRWGGMNVAVCIVCGYDGPKRPATAADTKDVASDNLSMAMRQGKPAGRRRISRYRYGKP